MGWQKVYAFTSLSYILDYFHLGSRRTHEPFAYFQYPLQKLLFRYHQRASEVKKNFLGNLITVLPLVLMLLEIHFKMNYLNYLCLYLSNITIRCVFPGSELGKWIYVQAEAIVKTKKNITLIFEYFTCYGWQVIDQ